MNLKITNLNFIWILLVAMVGMTTLDSQNHEKNTPGPREQNLAFKENLPMTQERGIKKDSEPSTSALDIPMRQIPVTLEQIVTGPTTGYWAPSKKAATPRGIPDLLDRFIGGKETDGARPEVLLKLLVPDKREIRIRSRVAWDFYEPRLNNQRCGILQ